MSTCDFLVVGGGVIGLQVARELTLAFPGGRVVVLEKEDALGRHASGRNSGVLHAGFYYTADSLKARFTREGNRLLHAYCDEKGIPVRRCGKLVVARDESELSRLDVLLERARANGVTLENIDGKAAREIEPRVKTFGDRALWSPTTSSVDPLAVLTAVQGDLVAAGVDLRFGTRFTGVRGRVVSTNRGDIEPGYVVNCAGLYADRVARAFGFSRDYGILPFKGLYLYSSEERGRLGTNVYPVPDLKNPFLGVHFTVAADGRVKIGPTAIPALWREQYDLLDRFRLDEFVELAARLVGLVFGAGFPFRSLAWGELRKQSARRLAALAGDLVTGVNPADFRHWGRPGIRAQLLHLKRRTLEMDFVVEGDDFSYHVLNSVSPAFTCSVPLARHVVADVRARLKG